MERAGRISGAMMNTADIENTREIELSRTIRMA
jgi:hypothetical protein